MFKAINEAPEISQPINEYGCTSKDTCWFCDTKDRCMPCDASDICLVFDK
ncbi:freyrasin family ranthipeptide [Lysinibacillus capsici]